MINFLSGKKTYILGALLVLTGVLQNWDMQIILNGLAVMTGRAAIAKIAPKG